MDIVINRNKLKGRFRIRNLKRIKPVRHRKECRDECRINASNCNLGGGNGMEVGGQTAGKRFETAE